MSIVAHELLLSTPTYCELWKNNYNCMYSLIQNKLLSTWKFILIKSISIQFIKNSLFHSDIFQYHRRIDNLPSDRDTPDLSKRRVRLLYKYLFLVVSLKKLWYDSFLWSFSVFVRQIFCINRLYMLKTFSFGIVLSVF